MIDPIDAAARALAGRTNVLVFTGAGISTESGIPDFRGPGGLWTMIDPDQFTIDRYVASRATRVAWWQLRFGDTQVLDARPNDGHRAVTALWRSGRLAGCVTQNIDGLHQKAGTPPEVVIELHGNVNETVCLTCEMRQPTVDVARRVAAGDQDPACTSCGGILKTAVVFFGELLPKHELERAANLVDVADAVLAVGSTLSVFPASSIPLEVVTRGHPLVIVNEGGTEFDDLADVVVSARAGTALPRLVEALA